MKLHVNAFSPAWGLEKIMFEDSREEMTIKLLRHCNRGFAQGEVSSLLCRVDHCHVKCDALVSSNPIHTSHHALHLHTGKVKLHYSSTAGTLETIALSLTTKCQPPSASFWHKITSHQKTGIMKSCPNRYIHQTSYLRHSKVDAMPETGSTLSGSVSGSSNCIQYTA